MADPKLAADVTGTNSQLSQFDDSHSNVIGQGATIDKNSSQLIDFAILGDLARICNLIFSI